MARNVPLDALDPHTLMQDRDESCCDTLYVICKSGARGAGTTETHQCRFTNVVNVEEGPMRG
ncbi:MAG: hypothetical protein R3B91_11035 [Planctomycetaceae bacterium]